MATALSLQSTAKDLQDKLDKMTEKYQQALKELEQYKVCYIAVHLHM